MKPPSLPPASIPLIGLALALCVSSANAEDFSNNRSRGNDKEPNRSGRPNVPDKGNYCHDHDKDPEPGCSKKCTRVDYEDDKDCDDRDRDHPKGDKDRDDHDKGHSQNNKDRDDRGKDDRDEKTRLECEELDRRSRDGNSSADKKNTAGSGSKNESNKVVARRGN